MMLIADYYTRAGTMWVFLVIGVVLITPWLIAAKVKHDRRKVARAHSRLDLSAHGKQS